MLILPIHEVFIPYENKPEKDCWELLFIWQDLNAFLLYIFFCLCWIIYFFKQTLFLRILLIIYSLTNLYLIYKILSFPMQDFLPYWGIWNYIILSLLVLVYTSLIESFMKKNNIR